MDRRQDIDPSCDCVIVSDHGSIRGNRPYGNLNLWQAIKHPERNLIAVISGGYRPDLPHEETIKDLQDAGCDIYCTGPGVPIVDKRYVAENDSSELVSRMLQTIGLVDSESDSAPDGVTRTGDGDIVVECFADGTCSVHTEFEHRGSHNSEERRDGRARGKN